MPAAVVDGLGQIAPHGVGGVPGDVRGEHHVGECEQRVVGRNRLDGEHVQAGGGQPAGAQRVDERLLVDDRAAGGVDQHRVGLHQGQRGAVEHAGGLLGQRQVQRDDVAGGQQFGQRPPAGMAVVAGAGVQHVGTHRGHDRLDPSWRCCRSRPVRRCSRRCHAPSRRGSGPTASPCPRGWRGPARSAGAARPASAARCPRRPTARSRRACSPPRCPAASRSSTSMVLTPAPILCTSRTRVRLLEVVAGDRPQHVPDHLGVGQLAIERVVVVLGAVPDVEPIRFWCKEFSTLSPGIEVCARTLSATASRSTWRWYRPSRCARPGW